MYVFIKGNNIKYPELISFLEGKGFFKSENNLYIKNGSNATNIDIQNELISVQTSCLEKGYDISLNKDTGCSFKLIEKTPSFNLLESICSIVSPVEFLPLVAKSCIILPERLKKYCLNK